MHALGMAMAGAARELPVLSMGPITSSHLVRWCAAQQNWDKIHYDEAFARGVAGLPERLVNGALKQHLLVKFLARACPGAALLRLDFRFRRPDHVGDTLEVHGILREHGTGATTRLLVELEIRNRQRGTIGTTGVAELAPGAARVPRRRGDWPRPQLLAWPEGVDESSRPLARRLGVELGQVTDRLASGYPIDTSRLRLFAHALEGWPAEQHDAAAARAAGWPGVAAPLLFPLHAIERPPGTLPLDCSPCAMGREGVAEAGRAAGQQWGLPTRRLLNGGSRLRFHSHAFAGETVVAETSVVGIAFRPGPGNSGLACVEVLNRYRTSTGRPLLDERFSALYPGVMLQDDRFRAAAGEEGCVAARAEAAHV